MFVARCLWRLPLFVLSIISISWSKSLSWCRQWCTHLVSTLYIPANDQQSFANLEECMDSPPFIHREEQDTNAAVDRCSSFHSVWSENVTRTSNTGVLLKKTSGVVSPILILTQITFIFFPYCSYISRLIAIPHLMFLFDCHMIVMKTICDNLITSYTRNIIDTGPKPFQTTDICINCSWSLPI